MISIYKIKPKFQALLKPVLISLHKWNITANQITLASLLLSLFIGICFWNSDVYTLLFLALPIGLFLRMALNALDGMMARSYNQQSKLGEVLNEVGDIISDFIIFLPLVKFESQSLLLVICFIFLSVLNETTGILSKAINGDRRYDGPMGKSDRAFIIGLYGIIKFFNFDMASYINYIFIMILILLTISTFTRLKQSLK